MEKTIGKMEFDGDALMLCDAITELLTKHGVEKEIVHFNNLDITGLELIEETLSDKSIVYNINIVCE